MHSRREVLQAACSWLAFVAAGVAGGRALAQAPAPAPASAPELVLAEGGEAKAVIVALPEAGQPARFAAEEIKAYLDRVTGARFTIVETLPASGTQILVGASAETRRLGVSTTDVRRDGFILRRLGERLLILGRDDKTFDVRAHVELRDGPNVWTRGWRRASIPECATVFAAYGFLERVAGVRWYFAGPDGECVPARPRLAVGRLDEREEPRFVYRCAYRLGHRSPVPDNPLDFNDYVDMGITDAEVTLWSLRNRRSTLHIPVNHMPSSHRLVERFGKDHPEWFARRADGTRENAWLEGQTGRASSGHLCYRQPGLIAEIVKDVDAFFSGRPATDRSLQAWSPAVANGDYFSLLPHDAIGKGCLCAACQARWDRDGPLNGLLSDLVWGHVAEVGRAIETDHPGKRVVCLAYNTYRALPRHVQLPANVIACPTALHTGGAADNLAMARIVGFIHDWRQFTGNPVCLWVYSARECIEARKLAGVPQVEGRAMGRFYREVADDVQGVFFENDLTYGFQHHLDLYLFHRLTWNPDLDAGQIVAEYCRDLFGPAAADIQRLIERVEDHWTRRIVKPIPDVSDSLGGAGYLDITTAGARELWEEIYSPGEMATLTAWLEAAAQQARGTRYEKRVALFQARFFGPLEAKSQEYWRERQTVQDRGVALVADRAVLPPVVDGHPDDEAWQAPAADRLGALVSATPGTGARVPAQGTSVQLLWDDTNLYVLFVCEETALAGLRATERQRDDLGVAEDDSVEIFLDPTNQRTGYAHILVNAKGAFADRTVASGGADPGWDSTATLRAWVDPRPGGNRWCVEAAIPFAALGGRPRPGAVWTANFCRSRPAKDDPGARPQLSTWSPFVQGTFNQPEKFGTLRFADGPRRK